MGPINFEKLRSEMVRQQIADRGIRSKVVLAAMLAVPREFFVPTSQKEWAYQDSPLPIAQGQTISQPYIVARMCEALALQGEDKVLEVGTGSGYGAAVLSHLAQHIYTVERIAALARQAAATLAALGYQEVEVLQGDGTLGWPEHAPFDAIVVTAGGPTVPQALKDQLKIGGRLVIPVGPERQQQQLLRLIRISENQYQTESLAAVRFVPLLGEQGWDQP